MGQHFRVRKGTFIRRTDGRGRKRYRRAAIETRPSAPSAHPRFQMEPRSSRGRNCENCKRRGRRNERERGKWNSSTWLVGPGSAQRNPSSWRQSLLRLRSDNISASLTLSSKICVPISVGVTCGDGGDSARRRARKRREIVVKIVYRFFKTSRPSSKKCVEPEQLQIRQTSTYKLCVGPVSEKGGSTESRKYST